jgi:hypothetical protein
MSLKQLSISFTETAEQEVTQLVHELHLVPIAQSLNSMDTPALVDGVKQLLSVLSDLFSVDLPNIEKDPEDTLRTVSRDINLSRLLRERGLFRLYRLLHQKDENNVPLFMTLANPGTGSPFSRQEEFIGWFCDEAHVARSLVFMRMAAIDRVLTLGFTLERAFSIVVSKPYAIQDTLHKIAEWDGGEIARVDPDVAILLARKLDPENADRIEAMAEAARTDPEAEELLKEAIKPIMAGLLEEVAAHSRAKEAQKFVQDVLLQPVVSWE